MGRVRVTVDEAVPHRLRLRRRIYYGWWIVCGAVVAQFVAIGMQAPVAGAFLVPMTTDLGWTRAQFAVATSLGTAISAMFGFFIGVYVDRFGARPLMLVGSVVVGAALIAMSTVNELWQFVLLRGVLFTVGFVLIGGLVVNVTISKWFVERRGWAISIASLGTSLGSVVVTPTMVRVVDQFGWRVGWVVLGVGAWLLVLPVALIMRRQPEDYGLLPDGAVEGDERSAATLERGREDLARSFTRGAAVRTPAMWVLVVAFGFADVGLVAMLFHAIPFLTDAGFSRTEASLVFSSIGVAAFVSKFGWGWAMQRYPPRTLTALSFVTCGVAAALMVPAAQAAAVSPVALVAVAWGVGVGGLLPLQEFVWASFFGRRYLGAVRSAALPVALFFGAGGPIAAGLYRDLVGSYDGAWLAFASLWLAASALILTARPPAPPAADRESAWADAGAHAT